ncbi:MAG: hypothetical protein ACOCV1_03760 [Bacillota bacterium]
MKKILLIISISILSIIFFSCNNNAETTNQTTEANTTAIEYDAIFPDYPDDDNFTYAEVTLYFTYDIPSDGFSDREATKAFYETKNLLYFDYANLDSNGNFDSFYLSSYTAFASLIYKSKRALFDDFNLLKNILEDGYISTPTISLYTTGESFQLTLESNINDLIEKTDKYFGTEITYDSIPFQVIHTSSEYFEPYTFDEEIIETYSEYIINYPDNDFELNEDFFDTYALIRTGFGHSGSLQIGDISDLFYLDDTTLEIAVSATAVSQIMTEDFNPYMLVISMEKTYLRNDIEVITHLHINFLNGYLYDRPYHNSYDDSDN